MDNNFLDKFIRKMLSNLDGGDPGDTWSQLSDMLDDNNIHSTSDEDLQFDDGIKASLVDLKPIEMPDWENFVPGLEIAENLDNLDQDINIDSSFKEHLEDFQVEYDAKTWDALSTKLDLNDVLDHENTNQDIDQVAYDSLLNYTVPQRAGDWEAFEEKLDNEPIIALPLLYKWKLAELAILTLLLLIFFKANPLVEKHTATNNDIIADVITVPSDEVDKNLSSKLIPDLKNQDSTTETIKGDKHKKSASGLIQNISVQKPAPARFNNNTKISTNNTSIVQYRRPETINADIDVNDDIVLEVSSSMTPIISGKDEQILKENSIPLLVVKEENISERLRLGLNTAKLPQGAFVSLPYDEEGMQVCQDCFKTESILRWRLGAHLDAKYDYIMTAYDNVFNLESYNHTTFSYGAGLSTSVLMGNWELESGFDYATRQYNTRTGEIIGNISNGYLKVKLDKIQMNILSIPLNLRYHFKDHSSKTYIYVHAGATMNVATHANYFIKSEFLNSGRRPTPDETTRLVEESNTASDKIYSLGWFEGGTYVSNRYFYANLGLGFERKISSRYSIFGQTTYSHYLDNKGFGPNDDRFNSVSISTGIRALFK